MKMVPAASQENDLSCLSIQLRQWLDEHRFNTIYDIQGGAGYADVKEGTTALAIACFENNRPEIIIIKILI
jgi:hypothetical protein